MSADEHETPKPCPFCGRDDTTVVNRLLSRLIHYVTCNVCEADGPVSCVGRDGAVKLWNERRDSRDV